MTYSLDIHNLNRLMERCTVQYQEIWELHCKGLEKRQQNCGRFHCDKHDNPLQYTIYATAIMLKAYLSGCRVSLEALERAIEHLNQEIEDTFDYDTLVEQADLIEQMVRAGLDRNQDCNSNTIENAKVRLKRLVDSFHQQIICRFFLTIEHSEMVIILLAYAAYHRLHPITFDDTTKITPIMNHAIQVSKVHLELFNFRDAIERMEPTPTLHQTHVRKLYLLSEHELSKLQTLLQKQGIYRRKKIGIIPDVGRLTLFEFYKPEHPYS